MKFLLGIALSSCFVAVFTSSNNSSEDLAKEDEIVVDY